MPNQDWSQRREQYTAFQHRSLLLFAKIISIPLRHTFTLCEMWAYTEIFILICTRPSEWLVAITPVFLTPSEMMALVLLNHFSRRWSAWSALIAPVRCCIASLLFWGFFRQLLGAGFQQLGPDGFSCPGHFLHRLPGTGAERSWVTVLLGWGSVIEGSVMIHWHTAFSPDRSVITQ